jgi:hypothetical protein
VDGPPTSSDHFGADVRQNLSGAAFEQSLCQGSSDGVCVGNTSLVLIPHDPAAVK